MRGPRFLAMTQLWKTPSTASAMSPISGKFNFKMGEKSFPDAPARSRAGPPCARDAVHLIFACWLAGVFRSFRSPTF